MTREQAVHKQEKLAAQLPAAIAVLRGSLLQRTVHHSSGCRKCARGEGHLLWVLNVGYPGGKTRQVSLRPDQVPQVREALENYRTFKRNLEAISEPRRSRRLPPTEKNGGELRSLGRGRGSRTARRWATAAAGTRRLDLGRFLAKLLDGSR